MPRWMTGLLAALAIWYSILGPALAGARVALVIGNGAYDNVAALPNPTRDAADMAAALRGIGFSVKELQNLGKNDFGITVTGDYGDRDYGDRITVTVHLIL